MKRSARLVLVAGCAAAGESTKGPARVVTRMIHGSRVRGTADWTNILNYRFNFRVTGLMKP